MSTILMCLALTVFHEARGEPAIGQQAVAQVILNRARIRGISPCEAVVAKGQFSWGPNRYIKAKKVAGKTTFFVAKSRLPVREKGWSEAISAAKAALASKNTFQNAEFFHAKSVKPRWKALLVEVFRVGGHVFYARKGQNSA